MSAITLAPSLARPPPRPEPVGSAFADPAAARAAVAKSDPPAPTAPAATPVPRVSRPARANLYSLEPGAGAGVLYTQVTPGYVSLYSAYAGPAAPGAHPESTLLERMQAAVSYRTASTATPAEMRQQVLDVLT